MNLPRCEAEFESDSESGDEEDEHVELTDCVALGASSRPQTQIHRTPPTTEHHHGDFFVDETVHDEGREFASFLGNSSLSRANEPVAVVSCDEISRMDCGTLGDEEDDLPPFDDWYTGVQSQQSS